MRGVALFLLGFLMLGFESPLLHLADVQWYAPDVVLVMVLYLGLSSRFESGLVIALALGLLKDGFCLAAPVGVFTEITVLTYLAARLLSRRVDLGSSVPLMATTAAASLVSSGLFLVLEAVFHRSSSDYGQIVRFALPLALATMLFAPILFGLLERARRYFDNHGRGRYLYP